MRYLLLITKGEADYEAMSEEARAALLERYEAYGRKMASAGVLRSGAMLEPTRAATTVRVRAAANGPRRVVTDGPFAETAEQIAGFMVIEVDDIDAALEWAAGHPDAELGGVEVRPIAPAPWERRS